MGMRNCHTMDSAKKMAARMRKKGFNASVYNKKGKGVVVYVKRK